MLARELSRALREVSSEQPTYRLSYNPPIPEPSTYMEQSLTDDITRKQVRLGVFEGVQNGNLATVYELFAFQAVEIVSGDEDEAQRRFESDIQTAKKFKEGVELDKDEASYWQPHWPTFSPTVENPSTLHLPDLIDQTKYEIASLKKEKIMEGFRRYELKAVRDEKANTAFLNSRLGK